MRGVQAGGVIDHDLHDAMPSTSQICDQMDPHREYDLVLYGATGYTGKYTAEWLQENAPADLKWAIAGRNAQKLEAIASELKELKPDRLQPGTKPCDHDLDVS
jgi:hypothetical protein